MVERDKQIIALKRDGLTFQQIADQLGISKSGAILGFQRVKKRVESAAEDEYVEYRNEQLARIATLREVVADIIAARHVAISNGRVVCEIVGRDGDGTPVYGDPYQDDGPVLAAIDRMVKLDNQEAELLGLKAETRVNISGGVSYEILGVPTEDLA